MKIYFSSHTSLEDIAEVYSDYDNIAPTAAQVNKIMMTNIKNIKANMENLSSYEYELLCLCFNIIELLPVSNGVNREKICHSMLSALSCTLSERKTMNRLYNKYINFIRNIKYFIKWNTNKDIRNVDELLYRRLKTGRFSITYSLYEFDVALNEVAQEQYKSAYNTILFTG